MKFALVIWHGAGWCVGKVRARRIRSNVLLLPWLLLEEDGEALPPLQLAAASPQASREPWGKGGFVLLLSMCKQQRELLLHSVTPTDSQKRGWASLLLFVQHLLL